jgi:hypothetical protein
MFTWQKEGAGMDTIWLEEPCWACGADAGEPCRVGHGTVVAVLERLGMVS